jgi:UDP:flavonoid glycosyltransferase YjiC (YdhE family)
VSVEAVWQVLLAQRKLISTFAPLYYKKTDWRSILKALARRDNFAFSKRVEQREGPPITFKDIPTMFFSAWEFDFPHEVKNKAYYVGPMVWLNRRETQREADFSAVLPEIQERRATSDQTRPLIYGSIGTFWLANADYVRRIIQVFAIRQDWDLVMSVGSSASVADFEPLPPNVRLFNSVPQLEMLQHADLMLTHGGISTINECIFLGVPMIVYSGGKIDQNGNAARVEYHGLGLRGNIHRESSAQIISKIERVLIEPQFKTNVHKMRQIYLAYHNSGKGLQIIDSMLQQSPRGPRDEPDPALANNVELS